MALYGSNNDHYFLLTDLKVNVNRYSIRENNFAIFIIVPLLNGGRFLKKKILINEIFFLQKEPTPFWKGLTSREASRKLFPFANNSE